jgi:hypothetical protein
MSRNSKITIGVFLGGTLLLGSFAWIQGREARAERAYLERWNDFSTVMAVQRYLHDKCRACGYPVSDSRGVSVVHDPETGFPSFRKCADCGEGVNADGRHVASERREKLTRERKELRQKAHEGALATLIEWYPKVLLPSASLMYGDGPPASDLGKEGDAYWRNGKRRRGAKNFILIYGKSSESWIPLFDPDNTRR